MQGHHRVFAHRRRTLSNTLRCPAREGHSAWPPHRTPSPQAHDPRVPVLLGPWTPTWMQPGDRAPPCRIQRVGLGSAGSVFSAGPLCSRPGPSLCWRAAAKPPESALGRCTPTASCKGGRQCCRRFRSARASARRSSAVLSAAPACVAGAREGQAQAVGRKGGDRQKSYLTFSQFLLEGKVLISRLIC